MSDKSSSFELVTLIRRLGGLLQQNIDLKLKPYGVARTQYAVLRYVYEANELPTSKLVEMLQIEPATLSGVIDTLESKGLVTRAENSVDKRRKDVQLTPAGVSMVKNIPHPGLEIESILRNEVDPGDVHILRAVGGQMVANLEAELRRQEKN